MTLEDLLTFRLGFGCIMAPPGTYPIQRAEEELQLATLGPPVPPTPHTPDEWITRLGTLPLMHQPGEQWMYNTGSQVLGVLLERAAGVPLRRCCASASSIRWACTTPDSPWIRASAYRLTTAYRTDPGSGAPSVADASEASLWSEPPSFPSAAAWLVSTIDDYWAFVQMMLGRGAYRGTCIVSPASVVSMTTDHLTPEQRAANRIFLGAQGGWGLGMATPAGAAPRADRADPEAGAAAGGAGEPRTSRPRRSAPWVRLGRRKRHDVALGPRHRPHGDPVHAARADVSRAPGGLRRLLGLRVRRHRGLSTLPASNRCLRTVHAWRGRIPDVGRLGAMRRRDPSTPPGRTRREPPRLRRVAVRHVRTLTPRMARVTFSGPDLEGLRVTQPASSIRVLLPGPGVPELVLPSWNGNEFLLPDGTRPSIRTFTPRRLDVDALELDVDIVIHDGGLAARWVGSAEPGDPVAISGPGRGYDIDRAATAFVLAGDETAIPAICQFRSRPSPGGYRCRCASRSRTPTLVSSFPTTWVPPSRGTTWSPVPPRGTRSSPPCAPRHSPPTRGSGWPARRPPCSASAPSSSSIGASRAAGATVRGYWKQGRSGDLAQPRGAGQRLTSRARAATWETRRRHGSRVRPRTSSDVMGGAFHTGWAAVHR